MAFDLLNTYTTGPFPNDVLSAQIDSDGQADLVVVVRTNNNSVEVHLGNGDGTFGQAISSPTGTSPTTAAAGDLTGDGLTDLVTANEVDITLLRGNGDGTFHAPASITLPGQFPAGYTGATPLSQFPLSVAVGDLNADGKLDLVVTTRTEYSVFIGNGYYGPYYETRTNGHVNVLLGNGAGGFGAAQVQPLGEGRWPVGVAVADLNGDGADDVLTTTGSELSAFLNDGAGAVGDPIHSGQGAGALPTLSVGDLDGDGNLDTLLRGANGLSVQKGDGLGHFAPSPDVNVGFYPHSAVLGDINADGKLDLVVGSSELRFAGYGYYGGYDPFITRRATVLLGSGQGSFSPPETSTLDTTYGNYYSFVVDLVLEDFTGDGLPDLAATDLYLNTLTVARNRDPGEVQPLLSVADISVAEGNSVSTNAVFTVMLAGDHTSDVRVDFATADVTAAAGSDYTSQSGTLTFAPGETSKTVSISIAGDTTYEDDEQFYISLSHAVGGQIADATGVSTIADNDAPPLVSINDVAKNEGNRGNTPINFTVSLSAASGKGVYVDYATANGTATTADSDYYATSGTLYFPPGATTAVINTSLRGDKRKEANETFVVNLTGAVDATIADSQGVGTIVNDDGGGGKGKPSLRIGNASVREGKQGEKVLVFTVTLSAASAEPVSVKFSTKNGSARSGSDYLPSSGQLHFAAGETTQTISVVIKGDQRKEPDESFYVDLFHASEASIADHRGRGLIVNDDCGHKNRR